MIVKYTGDLSFMCKFMFRKKYKNNENKLLQLIFQ